jgi:hypothetical protein
MLASYRSTPGEKKKKRGGTSLVLTSYKPANLAVLSIPPILYLYFI